MNNLLSNTTKYITAFVVFVLLFQSVCYAEPEADIEATAKYVLLQVPEPTLSSVGGEWAVIGIKRSGISVPDRYFEDYGLRISDIMDESGGDLGRKYTEYARLAAAVSELNMPSIIGKGRYDLTSFVNDYNSVLRTGVNGPIFALTAKHYLGDHHNTLTKQYLDYVISQQNADGSFGITKGVPDVDMTAMAISALAFYDEFEPKLNGVINRAFLYLSSVQQPDGSFGESPTKPDMNIPNCESTAQVVIAMKRYGLSPEDGFFTKNGTTPLTALAQFRGKDGGYKHTKADSDNNQIASEQALLALTEPQNDIRVLMYDNIWFESDRAFLQEIN